LWATEGSEAISIHCIEKAIHRKIIMGIISMDKVSLFPLILAFSQHQLGEGGRTCPGAKRQEAG
jgi:hypothetical protein